jgi:8-oxo-dGTP diphosphatase
VSGSVIPCVGAVATDEQGRLLMIKRGHEPGAGLWSIPGGRIEPGETDAEALVREMLEETSLTVAVGRLLGRVRRPFLDGTVIDIRDYAVTVTGGTLRPGDDAADARWIAAADLNSLEITEGLIDALTEWGVLGNLSPVFPILARKRRLAVSAHGTTIRLAPSLHRRRQIEAVCGQALEVLAPTAAGRQGSIRARQGPGTVTDSWPRVCFQVRFSAHLCYPVVSGWLPGCAPVRTRRRGPGALRARRALPPAD